MLNIVSNQNYLTIKLSFLLYFLSECSQIPAPHPYIHVTFTAFPHPLFTTHHFVYLQYWHQPALQTYVQKKSFKATGITASETFTLDILQDLTDGEIKDFPKRIGRICVFRPIAKVL